MVSRMAEYDKMLAGFIALPLGKPDFPEKQVLAPALIGARPLQRCWCHPLCLAPAPGRQPAGEARRPACSACATDNHRAFDSDRCLGT